MMIAADDTGDGTWDSNVNVTSCTTPGSGFFAAPACSGKGLSCAYVAGNGANGCSVGSSCPQITLNPSYNLEYEVRRPIFSDRRIWREFVTLTSFSSLDTLYSTTGAVGDTRDADAITPTVLLAAATRVTIRGVRVDPAGIVEFVTSTQRATRGFNLYETSDPQGANDLSPLNDALVETPTADSLWPILYSVRTRQVSKPFVLIEEVEQGGARRALGPYRVGDQRFARMLDRITSQMDRAGVPPGDVRVLEARTRQRESFTTGRREAQEAVRWKKSHPRQSASGVAIEVASAYYTPDASGTVLVRNEVQPGLVRVPASSIEAFGLRVGPNLRLTNRGDEVPFRIERSSSGQQLVFQADPLRTDYTTKNVYLLTQNASPYPMQAELTKSGQPPTRATCGSSARRRTSRTRRPRADPFLWDILVPDWGDWPYLWWDYDYYTKLSTFDIPNLAGNRERPRERAGRPRRLVEAPAHGRGLPQRQSVGTLVINGSAAGVLAGQHRRVAAARHRQHDPHPLHGETPATRTSRPTWPLPTWTTSRSRRRSCPRPRGAERGGDAGRLQPEPAQAQGRAVPRRHASDLPRGRGPHRRRQGGGGAEGQR